jgi:hypothetical protein
MMVLGKPLLNADLVVFKTRRDKALSGATVGIGRSGGDFMLVPEAIAEIGVGASDVLAKSMATSRLIERKVAAGGGRVLARFFGFVRRLLGLRIARQAH